MRVFLCEKPSQAKDIAQVLGGVKKIEGAFETQGGIVTYAVGHIIELADPDEYLNEANKGWRLESLPILPSEWKSKVVAKSAAQYKIIEKLIKQATEVIVATDSDREGEVIARELLDRMGYKGKIKRLWLSALDPESVRKGLANLYDGAIHAPLYHAGLARQRSDWLIGMNLTRAFTKISGGRGKEGVLSIGRVQTPTLALLVDRDRAIESFVKTPFYEVSVNVQGQPLPAAESPPFTARWLANAKIETSAVLADDEADLASEQGYRCSNIDQAKTVLAAVKASDFGKVSRVIHKRVESAPPLLFSLSELQEVVSKRYGVSVKEVLDVAQSLYEKHKLTSYPRTDCHHLPLSQLGEAPQVIELISMRNTLHAKIATQCELKRVSKCWNDTKVAESSHHGIIPTRNTQVNMLDLSVLEQRVYDLVARRYLMQFLPPALFDDTRIELEIAEYNFVATGRVSILEGWKIAELATSAPSEAADKMPALPKIAQDDTVRVLNAEMKTGKTSPPPAFTEGSLLKAMKNISKLIQDPQLKAVLKETAGIGTEATRADIIDTLKKRLLISVSGKKLISSDKGKQLVDFVRTIEPRLVDPVVTAQWEQFLEGIAKGNISHTLFIQKQGEWIAAIIERLRSQPLDATKIISAIHPATPAPASAEKTQPCPSCQRPMRLRTGKNGAFLACTGYPECKTTQSVKTQDVGA